MTDKPRVAQDPKAWQEGFNAGRRGLPRKNPYPSGSDEALAWISGFLEGKAKPLRTVKE
jgi:hypothetical protein